MCVLLLASRRHLGYSYFFVNMTASMGSLPVWASYTQCTGNEDRFFKCQMWGLREVTDCTSGTRAVVACSNSPTIAAPPPPASPYACELCMQQGCRPLQGCTSKPSTYCLSCGTLLLTAVPLLPASYTGTTPGALRLAPNDTSTKTYMYSDTTAGTAGGRLEFCYNGQWGTLCAVSDLDGVCSVTLLGEHAYGAC